MILEGRNLRFAYRASPVLDGIDIRIGPGITALVGPNAAGKSTLLKCLCGQLHPKGEVLVGGRKIAGLGRRELARTFSYLPQDLGAKAALTVFETVLLGRAIDLGWRVSDKDLRAAESALAELGIADIADRYIGELSGGQFQMAVIAQALAREPRILLMDEPTSSLDLEHQFSLCTWVRSLTDSRGISTVLALHDLNVAARFADTVCVLRAGRIVCTGPPAEVLTEDLIRSVYRVTASVVPGPDDRPLITPLGPA